MKVAVNLTWLVPGRVGGSEEYLTRQLSGVDPAHVDAELFCDPTFAAQHPELADRFSVRTMPRWSNRRATRIALEHTWLAAHTRDADVVHHGGGTLPMVGSRTTVLTIHDLQYLRFPEYFSSLRRRYLAAMMPRSARAATVVAVPSEFVGADVSAAFDVPAERIVVVPHGVPEAPRPTDERVRSALAAHGIGNRPYVMYPAITHPHKGHLVLVEMLDHLDSDTALVLTGGAGDADATVTAAIASSPHADRIHRLGRVSAEDRDALLAGADALVFPSEFEGFGAPLVEAMEVGTPVVCSSPDALVEVVGDAGIIVHDRSGEAWAHAVVAARRDHVDLTERGHRRRTAYTVEASGRAIEAAYRLAVS